MSRKMLITGGAGFIGSHAALHYASKGWNISILDNLSRKGSKLNLKRLQDEIDFEFFKGDIRNWDDIDTWFRRSGEVDAVLHMAAQVAVTTSIQDPRTDFEVNACGTLNTLEALRNYSPHATLIFASTNKVYGSLENRNVILDEKWYDFEGLRYGVSEDESLDFHSPYGCSKGAADQYVRDYARIYGLRTFVIRQSCIYGTRQFGVEDQGWLAWLANAALFRQPITIYGDGKQVRDLLWIEDLLDLYDLCLEKGKVGSIYNAGGGADKRVSVLGAIRILENIIGRSIHYIFSDWRQGDQKVFFSDNRKAYRELGWQPKTSVMEGIESLVKWIEKNAELIKVCLT